MLLFLFFSCLGRAIILQVPHILIHEYNEQVDMQLAWKIHQIYFIVA